MKLVSWNVNGLRACMNKGFQDFLNEVDADVICLQETKMQPEQADFEFPAYEMYWNSAIKKGYSGTAILTRIKPIQVSYDLGLAIHNDEGRSITLEFENFYLVTVYTPNAKPELARITYRMEWEDAFRAYVNELDKKKPVVICGDLNVAHNAIDLKNPKANVGNPGFSNEERQKFNELLASGYTDTFRYLNPDTEGAYTWWSYRFQARLKNAGWRIDYFLVSDSLKEKINNSIIHSSTLGSDHCPIELVLSE